MIDDEALLSTIIADPDDDRPRLVYADWLEQHGQLDRARLIRVQIELAHLPDNDDEPTALQVEEEQLEAACEKTLPQLEGITWGGFERGLVRSVCADSPAAFRRHASSIADVGSVHRLSFDKQLDGFAVLAEVSAFARFTDLGVYDDDHTYDRNGDPNHRFNDDLQAVLASAHCPCFRSLDLITCQLGPRGAKALAECSRLGSLIHLDLLDNYIGDEGMAALAASPYLSALRKLRIDLNNIGPAGVEALAASVSLGGLEDLFLGDAIGPAAGVALGRSPYLTQLRELKIHDEIGALGAAGLAQAPNLAGLRYLDLCCASGPDAARALAESPYLRQLKSLLLYACRIGDEGAKALAGSPVLASLESLDLSYNKLTDEGARALARSPMLASLESLDLGGNDLTDEGARALAASPYLGGLKHGGLRMRSCDFLTPDGVRTLRARFGDTRVMDFHGMTISVIGGPDKRGITMSEAVSAGSAGDAVITLARKIVVQKEQIIVGGVTKAKIPAGTNEIRAFMRDGEVVVEVDGKEVFKLET